MRYFYVNFSWILHDSSSSAHGSGSLWTEIKEVIRVDTLKRDILADIEEKHPVNAKGLSASDIMLVFMPVTKEDYEYNIKTLNEEN